MTAKYLFVKAIVVGLLFVLFACSDDSGGDAQTREAAQPTPASEQSREMGQPDQATQSAPASAQPGETGQPDQSAQSTPSSEQPDREPLNVVTTITFIADWVENVGGDRVEATSLLGIGDDPHTFSPGPRAVGTIADADLVLTIGLNLESYSMRELIENVAQDPSKVIALGEAVDPIEFVEIFGDEDGHDHEHDHEDEREHTHGPLDPHFWFDPLRVKKAVWDISARLSVLDPAGVETYRSNAESYNARLDELRAWIMEQVARIPEERRLLVTSHDSMGYFATEYGFKVLGAILSTATEAEPSADDIARLSVKVEEYGVPAVFGEITISERLAATVASEAGATLVRLHSESLGPEGSGAETYIEMIRTNVTLIVEALE